MAGYCQGISFSSLSKRANWTYNHELFSRIYSQNWKNSEEMILYAAAAAKSLQSCQTLCDPIDGKPTRLLCPWDSPGKNTGVGCHFLLQCMKVKSESEVAQSCPTQRSHGLQPTRLLRPWDFPGKSTGVGCHCLLWYYILCLCKKGEDKCALIHRACYA